MHALRRLGRLLGSEKLRCMRLGQDEKPSPVLTWAADYFSVRSHSALHSGGNPKKQDLAPSGKLESTISAGAFREAARQVAICALLAAINEGQWRQGPFF